MNFFLKKEKKYVRRVIRFSVETNIFESDIAKLEKTTKLKQIICLKMIKIETSAPKLFVSIFSCFCFEPISMLFIKHLILFCASCFLSFHPKTTLNNKKKMNCMFFTAISKDKIHLAYESEFCFRLSKITVQKIKTIYYLYALVKLSSSCIFPPHWYSF